MFEEVGPFSAPDGTSDETDTKNTFRYSGSNETMQNVLGSIVFFWRIFEIFFTFRESRKFELLCFSSNLGETCYGGNIGQRTT